MTRLANPRRTTLAALRSGRCEIDGPGCHGSAVRIVRTDAGARHACSACGPR